MKKFWNLLLMTFAVVGVVACTEQNPVDEPQAESKLTLVSEASLEFAAEGGEGTIEYTLENAVEGVELSVECEAEWVTNIVVGETITFAVAENEVEEPRATKVLVAYGELSFEVAVNQAAAEPAPVPDPVLTLTSEATLSFAADGGEGTIEYTLENAVEGVELCAECEAEWVTNIVVGETITFAVAENEIEEPRATKIVVAYGELSFEVAVNQAAAEPAPVPDPVLTLTSEATLSFEADGGEGTIEYTLENAVEGVELRAECEADWVTNIVVGQTITFAVAGNEVEEPRATKVVVAYGELSFEVAVNQAAAEPAPVPDPVLTLTSEATLSFEADGGEGTIEYTLENAVEGVELRAECEAKWVTNLTVGQTITFAVAENEVEEPRATKVVVAYGELSFEVAINQAAAEPAPVPDPVLTLTSEATLSFEADGGEGTIEYTLENAVEGVELRAECEAEWVTNIVVGEAITFAVAENKVEKPRATKVVVAYGELSFEVAVMQEAGNAYWDGPSYDEEDVEW